MGCFIHRCGSAGLKVLFAFMRADTLSDHQQQTAVAAVPMFWARSLFTPRCHLCWDPTRSSTQSLFIFLIRDLWHALRPLGVSLGLFSVDPDQFFITYHPSGSPACLIQNSLVLPSQAALWEKIKMEWRVFCVALCFPWFTKLLPGIIYCSYNKSWGWTKGNWASTYSIAVVI